MQLRFPISLMACLVAVLPAAAQESVAKPSYDEAIRCSASHLLLHAVHAQRELHGLAKHYEGRMSLWINYAIVSSGKTVDQAFSDQTRDFDLLNEKFVNEENDPANEEFISMTVGKCSDLEKRYARQINSASE